MDEFAKESIHCLAVNTSKPDEQSQSSRFAAVRNTRGRPRKARDARRKTEFANAPVRNATATRWACRKDRYGSENKAGPHPGPVLPGSDTASHLAKPIHPPIHTPRQCRL